MRPFLQIPVFSLVLLTCSFLFANTPAEIERPPRYDRSEWRHWIDEDRDCQNTRHEILIERSEVAVQFRSERGCKVRNGRWYGPYTARWYSDSSDVHIDHLVSLKHAHDSGGHAWSAEQKEIFANDVENLLVVQGRENLRKGAKGPNRYRPPNREFWCEYSRRWRWVKEKYQLSVSERERRAVQEMMDEEC